ncbi:MAG TPA: dCTP deaminase [Candidatus Paceibacterota bacterium]|nr:dCTP deaminase [Candidatus Paceibacterota bacterium]HRY76604.1 dCTP deaminase [Candidatus Paceibacterota bacterium]
MILSDKTLKKIIDQGRLVVKPITKESIQPASIDCRLGNHFLLVARGKNGFIDLDSVIKYREIEADQVIIPPHSFLLATTLEWVELPNNLTAFVEGRSSIGRMGLFIQNAGWIDPGFKGRITLELYNANFVPIKVNAGRRICQLVFCKMDSATKNPYRGKYQGQNKSVGSKIYQDAEVFRKKK